MTAPQIVSGCAGSGNPGQGTCVMGLQCATHGAQGSSSPTEHEGGVMTATKLPRGYLVEPCGNIEPADIVSEVARGFNVAFSDVVGDDRRYHIVKARSCAMAVVREMTSLSYPAIGELFGKHHTTVMSHVEHVRADPQRARAVALVIEQLTGLFPELASIMNEPEGATA